MSSNQLVRIPLRPSDRKRERFLRCNWVKDIGYVVDIIVMPSDVNPSTAILEERNYHRLSSALRRCLLIAQCEEAGVRWEERKHVSKSSHLH